MKCSNCGKDYKINNELKLMFPKIKRNLCSECLLIGVKYIIDSVNKINIQKYLNRSL